MHYESLKRGAKRKIKLRVESAFTGCFQEAKTLSQHFDYFMRHDDERESPLNALKLWALCCLAREPSPKLTWKSSHEWKCFHYRWCWAETRLLPLDISFTPAFVQGPFWPCYAVVGRGCSNRVRKGTRVITGNMPHSPKKLQISPFGKVRNDRYGIDQS